MAVTHMNVGGYATTGSAGSYIGGKAARWFATIGSAIILASFGANHVQAQLTWIPFGAAPNTGGQVENMGDGEVSGAINVVAPHPTDEKILFVGAVNGGIWMTDNATDVAPTWKNLTDDQPSLSISALEFDPEDGSHKTLLAGTGGFSSFGAGGPRVGLLRSTDGGNSWTLLSGGGLPDGLNVSGVAPRGNVIILSAVAGTGTGHRGIWRSTDQGAVWKQVSGDSATGLPAGVCFDLASDQTDPDRLYANAGDRYYRSTDKGATWTKVSSAPMEAKLSNARNVDAAMGKSNNIFVAIVGADGRLAGVFHSSNGGDAWNDLGAPTIGGVGIHPGGQGSIHLSIAADPVNANLVYVGGDRQDGAAFPTIPNAIGARDYSGCLFRGDASKPAGQRWAHLTHSSAHGAAGGGTASGSAPHADSRDMDVANNGDLVEGDDGGVYKRTSPQTNAGDWFSLNGNLQTAEYHAVAWDAIADIVVAGAQDTGSGEQFKSQQPRFRSIATADGGVVAVDDISSSDVSIRYSSNQFLGRFRRRIFDADNNLQSATFIPMSVAGGGSVSPQFYTPIVLNAVLPERLIVGGADGVYESLNRGDTCRRIGPFIVANGSGLDTIAYGAQGNPDVLYVGASDQVFVRTSPHPAPLEPSASYDGGPVMGVANDLATPNTAYVISPGAVHQTVDAGGSWTDLSANLSTLKPGILRSIAYIPAPGGGAGSLLVGSDSGVFVRQADSSGAWVRMAAGLPNAPVYHLEYDGADEILLAGTLGRGAWRLDTASPSAAIMELVQTKSPAPETPASGEASAADGDAAGSGDEAETSTITQIRDGVIIDPREQVVYLMLPEGGIEAVQLGSGKTLWNTKAADKPLAIVQDVLVSQAAAPKEENVLKIVAIDRKTGDEKVEGQQPLPAGVTPSIDQTLDGTFSARASVSGDDVFATWRFLDRPMSGLPPGAEQGIAPGADETTADAPQALMAERVGAKAGVVQMNLISGETKSLNIEPPPVQILDAPPNVMQDEGAEPLKDVAGEQYRSVDGRHVIGSVQTGEITNFHRYTLSIYDAESAQKIAQIRSHAAILPMVVVDDYVVFESSPYTRRLRGELVDRPLMLNVVDRKSNKAIWSRPIRDTSYQGPLPP